MTMTNPTMNPTRTPAFGWAGVLISVLFLLPFWPLAAQPSHEAEAQAEVRALGFVRAIAQGDATAARTFMDENFTPATLEAIPEAARARILERLTTDLEGAEPAGVLVDDGELAVVAERRDGHQVTFRFGFEPAAPYRLEGFSVEMGGPGEGSEIAGPELRPGMSEEETAAAIGRFAEALAEKGELSGTVLAAHRGKPIFRGAYGLAHRGYGVANHLGTRFDLGSINKLFTKVAVARLMADGKLSLDDPIAKWLPDYPDRETAARVTVRHLVEHTSGLGDIFTEEYSRSAKTRFRRPEDFFPLFADQPLLFEPGTSQQYSNAGYQVLGAIVAAAGGMPYHEAIRAWVFEPAGMTFTAFVARDEPTPDVAVGYTTRNDDGKLRNNLYRLPVVGSPAGSSFSTVDDLLRFLGALRSGKLVPPEYAAWALHGPEPGSGEDPSRTLDHLQIGVAGGAPGVNATVEVSGEIVVIVLTNQDPPAAGRAARPLMKSLVRALSAVEGPAEGHVDSAR